MQPKIHTLLLVSVVVLAYLWLQFDTLAHYSVQLVALLTFLFFVSRFLQRKNIKHWLPDQGSVDMLLITFSLLLVIGATGNLQSPLAFLIYIHLFALVMTNSASTAFWVSGAVILFHYALAPVLQTSDWSALLTIPVVLLIFLFAKEQYQEVLITKKRLEVDKDQLASDQVSLKSKDTTIERLAAANRSYQDQLETMQITLAKLKLDLLAIRQRYFACEPEAKLHIDQLCETIDQSVSETPEEDTDFDQKIKS